MFKALKALQREMEMMLTGKLTGNPDSYRYGLGLLALAEELHGIREGLYKNAVAIDSTPSLKATDVSEVVGALKKGFDELCRITGRSR